MPPYLSQNYSVKSGQVKLQSTEQFYTRNRSREKLFSYSGISVARSNYFILSVELINSISPILSISKTSSAVFCLSMRLQRGGRY